MFETPKWVTLPESHLLASLGGFQRKNTVSVPTPKHRQKKLGTGLHLLTTNVVTTTE